jgi:hypothetical protein
MRKSTIFLVATLAACANPEGPRARPPSLAPVVVVPPRAGQAARQCSTPPKFFASTVLADREGWYGKHLLALEERPLCGSVQEVYRLTWLPTFHPSIVVRVERDSAGYQLRAKRESGAGGYAPGHLAVDASVRLTTAEVRELSRLLKVADFWSLPTRPAPDDMQGLDGAQWVIEGLVSDRYHVVDRWSPMADGPDAKFRRLAEWMLTRSGLASKSLVHEY